MNIKAEKKMRIQAYHYRDGMLVKDIAKEVGISQAIVRKYLASVDEQLASGEIKKEDIISSCDALGIDRPKKVRKQEVDEMIAEQGMTQQELSENVQALDKAVAKAGEHDGGKENIAPIKRNYGGRPKMIVEIDGKPMNIKKPADQSDYVLTIMSHIYDELVAGRLALKYYLMENGMHELQFTEVQSDNSNRTGR